MLFPQHLRRALVACVLLGAAVGTAALTIGRSRGVALIGRPLDVSIPVTLDNPGQATDLCAEADVFHGDTRIDASKVTSQVEGSNGRDVSVRVRSSAAVDEPVVTVYLRLGCNLKNTRRYVLLAEEPGDFVPPAAAAAAAPQPAPPQSMAPVAAARTESRIEPRPARESRNTSRARPNVQAVMAPRGAAEVRLETSLAPARGREQQQSQRRASNVRGGRPRLQVDLLDLSPAQDPQLRVTPGLAGVPTTDEAVRAQAAALWRAINAQPQDVLRDLQRVQALETDVNGLRTLVAGNERTLQELRQQLSEARQERTLTLAAIALLVLLLAAVAVTWWLRRSERARGEWWRRGEAAGPGAAIAVAVPGEAPPGAPARPREMDLRVDESMFESLKQSARGAAAPMAAPMTPPMTAPMTAPVTAAAAAAVTAASSATPPAARPVPPASTFHSSLQSPQSMRMVKAEELVDIQQQADFFMSLGQTDQAIEVLESHIRNHAETSALVWLDLLAIYRALKRREDYELLRADFQRVFNAEVPDYDTTPTMSGGLEDYPRALTRIAALWPSPKVMGVIEESIFRKPGLGGEPFDLEAYRELVMLYNLGREVVQPEESEESAPDWSLSQPAKSGFYETSMQPLSVKRRGEPVSRIDFEMDSGPGAETNLGDMLDQPFEMDSMRYDEEDVRTTVGEGLDPQVPRPSPRLGLDIDLSAPPEPDRRAPVDSHIDFELSEPGDDEAGRERGTK
jgi:pilus assembly protein FimV